MSDPNPPTEPDGLGPAVDADPTPDSPMYEVVTGSDDCAVAEGLLLPRRRNAGVRGTLLVDDRAGLVFVLDADDDRKVFVGRARRPVAGNTTDVDYPRDGSDHIIRAAYEHDYDVIAAPWVNGEAIDAQFATDDPRPAFTGGGGATPHGITAAHEPPAAAPAPGKAKPRKRTAGGKA